MRNYDIELKFAIEGATAEELARGEAAAWAVFETAGVNPWAAARAVFKQEGEMGGMLPGEGELAEVWREAEFEAVQACCAGWQTEPWAPNLMLEGAPVPAQTKVFERCAFARHRTLPTEHWHLLQSRSPC